MESFQTPWCSVSCAAQATQSNSQCSCLTPTSQLQGTFYQGGTPGSLQKSFFSLIVPPKITPLARPYTRREIDTGLSSVKAGKATGVDGIYPEFPKSFCPNACDWLASLFTVIHSTGVIPKIWREAKVIAIL